LTFAVGLFAASMLGIVSLARIIVSSGRLRGLGYALLACSCFPLSWQIM